MANKDLAISAQCEIQKICGERASDKYWQK